MFQDGGEKSIIKVIGVGGGGCNAVNHMFNQNIPYVSFAVCNTDLQHLKMSPVPCKILIGEGLGAGNKPEVGRQTAEENAELIKTLFDKDTQMVFITAGMGGGTGTGAGPVVARLAKEAGLLTIGIVTVPFMFEGISKIHKAIQGAKEMKKYVDALLVINNENLVEIYKDLTLGNAFQKADDTLTNAASSISEIISERCYVNVDFKDVCTTLRNSGTAIISTAYGEGENRITKAIENALHSPLLKAHDIKTSKRLMIKVSHNLKAENPVKMAEVNEITEFTAKLPPTIDVKWGLSDNPELGDTVKITILASGFDVTLGGGTVMDGGNDSPKDTENPETEETTETDVEIFYGGKAIVDQKFARNRAKYIVLKPEQFDDDEMIRLLETSCAFNRDSNNLGSVSHTPRLQSKPETSGGRPEADHQQHSGKSNEIVF